MRCGGSYALSLLGVVRVKHLPAFLSVEPANFCQLRCPECPVGMAGGRPRSPQLLSDEVWQRVLNDLVPYAHTVQFYFQGEPLLNHHLPRMIADVQATGAYTIVSTNAQALTQDMAEALVTSGLRRIIISMDGLSEDSYSAYRIGGSLTRTKEALRLLQAAKRRCHTRYPIVELQCLRLRTNEHEWDAFRRVYRSLGANHLCFKTAQLYGYSQGHPLMPTKERYSRYVKGKDGLYHMREKWWHRLLTHRLCYRLWAGCVISTEGDMLPCCYDKAHVYSYGNILLALPKQVWYNAKATAFRREVIDKKTIDICANCLR